MTREELRRELDKVYAVGVKNGRILMKNKILMSLNRDWKLFLIVPETNLLIKVLKKIYKLK